MMTSQQVESDESVRAMVLISDKPGCFIAGADISMIEACKTAEEVEALSTGCQEMLQRMESGPKPVVAAIMGSCLGGGLEMSMACHYRLAVKDRTTLGLPEVLLGLLPGGGGTQRFPKLVGVPASLDLMLTGKSVPAAKAAKMGLVDGLVNPLGPGLQDPDANTLAYLKETAIKVAQDLASGTVRPKRGPKTLVEKVTAAALQYDWPKDQVFKRAKAAVMKQTGGLYPAPLKILEVCYRLCAWLGLWMFLFVVIHVCVCGLPCVDCMFATLAPPQTQMLCPQKVPHSAIPCPRKLSDMREGGVPKGGFCAP